MIGNEAKMRIFGASGVASSGAPSRDGWEEGEGGRGGGRWRTHLLLCLKAFDN